LHTKLANPKIVCKHTINFIFDAQSQPLFYNKVRGLRKKFRNIQRRYCFAIDAPIVLIAIGLEAVLPRLSVACTPPNYLLPFWLVRGSGRETDLFSYGLLVKTTNKTLTAAAAGGSILALHLLSNHLCQVHVCKLFWFIHDLGGLRYI
jgi:hypothetical protein